MPVPYSRRRALQVAGLGLAAAAAGAAGLAWTSAQGAGTAPGSPADGAPAGTSGSFVEPVVLESSGGVLDVMLTAARGAGPLAGRTATTLRYNDGVPGPTLHCRPGDTLRVTLVNRLGEPTNLHVHGLQVSPRGNADNPFVMVQPGQSFDYEYAIPPDHPAGTFWYHPHHHGLVADQVFSGLYGAIVVEDPVPVSVSADRILLVSDITLDGSGAVAGVTEMQRRQGREGQLVLVNGQLRPALMATAGRERWRLVNACTARYLRLRLDGQHLTLLGVDLPAAAPTTVTEVVLAPGNRADLLVATRRGVSALTALPADRGAAIMAGTGMGGATAPPAQAGVELATLTVSGPDPAAVPAPPAQPVVRDLRGLPVARRRQVTLAMTMAMGAGAFTFDGRSFDPARTDQTVTAGDVEEWTFTNTSPMAHPVHLHVWPMQLVADGGIRESGVTWRDVVNVPALGSTTVRIAFDRNAGRSVYHCHILDHEDLGMMAVIQVS